MGSILTSERMSSGGLPNMKERREPFSQYSGFSLAAERVPQEPSVSTEWQCDQLRPPASLLLGALLTGKGRCFLFGSIFGCLCPAAVTESPSFVEVSQ